MSALRALRDELDDNLKRQRELQHEEQEIRAAIQVELAATSAAAAPAAPTASSTDWAGRFEWDDRVAELLRTRFGHSSGFRPLHREVINATLSGRDAFAVLPTGSGKSLLFQLPGLLAESGLTVVVSPLVSLMTDQVQGLTARGVHAALLAADVTDRTQSTEIHRLIESPSTSALRFLYVTPERIAKSKLLLAKLQKGGCPASTPHLPSFDPNPNPDDEPGRWRPEK